MKDQSKQITDQQRALLDKIAQLERQTAGLRQENQQLQNQVDSLKQTHEHNRAAVHTARDAIYIKDRYLRYVQANPAMARMFGMEVEKLLGMTDEDLFGPEVSCQTADLDCCVLEGEVIEQEHTRNISGRRLTFHEIKVPVRDNHNQIIGLCGIARDITRRKRVEQELRLMEAAIQSSVSAIAFIDLKGRLLYANPASLGMWGYLDSKRVVGEAISKFVNMLDGNWEIREQLFELGSWEGERLGTRSNGARFDVHVSLSLVRSSAGQPLCIMGSYMDITDSKRAASALRESEERYRLLVDNIIDVIWTMDLDGRFTYASPSVEQLRGFTPEEAIKLTLWETLTPESAERAMTVLANEMSKDPDERPQVKVIELEQTHKNGSTIWTEVVVRPIIDPEGQIIALQGSTRDIQERRFIEEQLRHAKEAAEAASRAKSEFLANMSHEFRTPLNGVIGMVGLLMQTELDEEQQQYAEVIRHSGDVLLKMVEDVLNLSKVEAGKLTLEQLPFRPAQSDSEGRQVIRAGRQSQRPRV